MGFIVIRNAALFYRYVHLSFDSTVVDCCWIIARRGLRMILFSLIFWAMTTVKFELAQTYILLPIIIDVGGLLACQDSWSAWERSLSRSGKRMSTSLHRIVEERGLGVSWSLDDRLCFFNVRETWVMGNVTDQEGYLSALCTSLTDSWISILVVLPTSWKRLRFHRRTGQFDRSCLAWFS